jgi:transcriptional accessory protein Tex/SPT6
VPISSLSANRLDHDDSEHALVDWQGGTVWALGDMVEVKLIEVDTAMGRLSGRLVDHTPGPRSTAILKSRRRHKTTAPRGRRRRS